ncbi:hypothetical protein [Couchioplanes caeruleus]|nr:hypothetical protein [Couchioplanes caeruleus]
MGEQMVVLDADLLLQRATELSGWSLQQPPAAEFDALAPADRRAWVWDSGTRSGRCCVLRRPDPRVVVPTGLRLPRGMAEDMTLAELPLECWQPLLLLNLRVCSRPSISLAQR